MEDSKEDQETSLESQVVDQISFLPYGQRTQQQDDVYRQLRDKLWNYGNRLYLQSKDAKVKSTEVDRDWNGEFQAILDKDLYYPSDCVERKYLIRKFMEEFTQLAKTYVKQIVNERFSYSKTIVPMQMLITENNETSVVYTDRYLHNGMYIKYCYRNNINNVKDLTTDEIYDLCKKISVQKLHNVSILIGCHYEKLNFPAISVIEYKGYTLQASTVIPVSEVLYDISEYACKVTTQSAKTEDTLKSISNILHLKQHLINLPQSANKKAVNTSAYFKYVLGKDNRLYIVPSGRLMPQVPPANSRYRLDWTMRFRPELLLKSETPLSSDAFIKLAVKNASQLDKEAVECHQRLKDVVIPEFATLINTRFDNKNLNNVDSLVSFDFEKEVHDYGINFRFLGLVFSEIRVPELQNHVLTVLASRVFAKIFRKSSREFVESTDCESEEAITKHYVDFFNSVLDESNSHHAEIWTQLSQDLPKYYISAEGLYNNIKQKLNMIQLFLRLSRKLQVQWDKAILEKYQNQTASVKPSFKFSNSQLVGFPPKIKSIDAWAIHPLGHMLNHQITEPETFMKLELRERITKFGEKHVTVASSYAKLGQYYMTVAQWSNSETCFEEMVKILEGLQDLPLMATGLTHCGDLYYAVGDFARAEEYYQKSCDLRQKILNLTGGSSLSSSKENNNVSIRLDLCVSYARLAQLRKSRGNFKDAQTFIMKSIELTKEEVSDNDMSTLFTSLGMIQMELKKYEEAEKYLKRALELCVKAYGEQHVKVSNVHYHLGLLSLRQQKLGDAEDFFRKSLVVREITVGGRSILLAFSLAMMATVATINRKLEEASKLYQRALDISEGRENDAESDYLTISLRSRLAFIYYRLGNMEQCKELLSAVVQDRETLLGKPIADNVSSLQELAEVYHKLGFMDKAETVQLRALLILANTIRPQGKYFIALTLRQLSDIEFSKANYNKALELQEVAAQHIAATKGTQHLEYTQCLHNLGNIYYRKAELQKAEEYYTQAFELRKSRLPKETHPDIAQSIHSLAYLYTTQGFYDKAENFYAKALQLTAACFGDNHPECASIMNNKAWVLFKKGLFEEAENLYSKSLTIREKTLGSEHPDVARSLHEIAELYTSQSKFPKAEEYNRRALSIREKVFGNNHVEVARSKYNLAQLFFAQGKYTESEQMQLQCIEILRKTLSENHPKLATSYHDLGKVYYRIGKYERSEEFYLKSLEIRKIAFTNEMHPDIAQSLAYLYTTQGLYSKAEEFYKKSLEITEKLFSPTHPEVAQSRNNLAWIFFRQAKYKEARELYEASLKIRLHALGEDHVEVARSYHEMAELHLKLGEYSLASDYCDKALGIRKKAYGKVNNHPDVARSLSQKGLLLMAQGKYVEALGLQEESLKILEASLGKNHSKVAEVVHYIGKIYVKQGQYEDGEAKFKSSLQMRENVLGKSHPDIAADLDELGYLYTSQSKYKLALELYERSQKIIITSYGNQHPEVAVVNSNIAWIYFKQAKYTEAENLYRASLTIREKAFGENHADVARSCHELAELFLKTGNFAEAEQFNQRSLTIRSSLFGTRSLEYARSRSQQSSIYFMKANYNEAETLQTEALDILYQLLDQSHPKIAQAVNELAKIYFKQGKYEESENLYKQALQIREKCFSSNHPDIAESLSGLAYLFGTLGMYKTSAQYYQRALDILHSIFGIVHPEVVMLKSSIAWISFKQGRYQEAEETYLEALALREKYLGSFHPDVARSLHELSELYQKLERFNEAESHTKRALEIREKVLGEMHADVAGDLEALATIYIKQKKFDEAEGLLLRSFDIFEKALGTPVHSKVAQVCFDLATLYEQQGRLPEAEIQYKKSLDIRKHTLGETHPAVAESLHGLANVYTQQQKRQEAEKLYTESINILKSRLGLSHPDVAALLEDFDSFQKREGERQNAAQASWGSMFAAGLISSAMNALKNLRG